MAHLPFRRVILASAFHPGNGTRATKGLAAAEMQQLDVARFQPDEKFHHALKSVAKRDSSRNSTAIEENFDAAS